MTARLTKESRENARRNALYALRKHEDMGRAAIEALATSDAAHAAALVGLAGRVVDWLVKVGAHDADCDRSAGRETCTCGYSALLADARRWREGRG